MKTHGQRGRDGTREELAETMKARTAESRRLSAEANRTNPPSRQVLRARARAAGKKLLRRA